MDFILRPELLGKSEDAVRNKCNRMGLDDDDQENLRSPSSDGLLLPADIPSFETVLKIAVAAMMALQTVGLSKNELVVCGILFILRTYVR